MIRNKYVLSQYICCGITGQFKIHESHQEQLLQPKEGEQKSQFTQLNYSPQLDIGQFQESNISSICCCSFKPIRQLQLKMYGQWLSSATSQSTCCLNMCNGALIVSTHNNVLIGTIKKTCSAYCSSSILIIQNQSGVDILAIRMKCCQCANIFPRMIKFAAQMVYEIVDSSGKEVGIIMNKFKSCRNSVFSLRDDFQVQFTGITKQKEKILVLNAIVFLNQLRHQFC